MSSGNIAEFNSNDSSYFSWLEQNPSGFVVNTERSKNPKYMVLHTATCRAIAEGAKNVTDGGFTERDYIKICSSDVASLRDWTVVNGRPDGSFSSGCGMCKPL